MGGCGDGGAGTSGLRSSIPLTVAALAAPVQVLVGDWAARDVATTQPTKLAALEGLYQTTRRRPGARARLVRRPWLEYGIKIPHLLSFLSFHSWNAKVEGLAAVPADERPPVNVVRIAFQTMVGIGSLLALIGVVYVAVWVRRKRLPESVVVLPGARRRRAAVGRRADRRLGRDRGRPPAVGRLPGDDARRQP